MDVFNEASRLNHQGVDALLDGRDDLAVHCFAACVTMMKQILSSSRALVEPQPSTSILQVQIDQESPNNNNHSTGSQTVQLPPVIMHGPSKDDDSILFNRAILISNGHPHPTPSSDPRRRGLTQHDIHVGMAAVIYNLAIAHHRRGREMGLAVFTHKAEKLYTMALQFWADDDLGVNNNNNNNSSINSCYNNNNNSIGFLVKLASINNLLDIRLESGDHDSAKECLHRVYSLLQSSGFSTRDEISSPVEADIKVLLGNLLLLQPSQVAPAA
jgi:hypothetical protein